MFRLAQARRLALFWTEKWFLIGLLTVTFYAGAPWAWSFFKADASEVFVPINDQYHFCGDDKHYAANVRAVRENFFEHRNAISKEIGNYDYEIARAGTFRLAAFLGLFAPNDRLFYSVFFLLGVAINFSLIYFLSRLIGLNSSSSTIIGLLQVLWLPLVTPGIGPDSFVRAIDLVWNARKIAFFGADNDNFRFVILSVATLWTWPLLIMLTAFNPKKQTPLFMFGILFLFVSQPYSYPALLAFGFAISFFYTICLYFEGHRRGSLYLIGLALAALLIVSALGYWEHVLSAVGESQANRIGEIYFREATPRNMSFWINIIFSPYSTIPLLALLCLIGKKTEGLFQSNFRRVLTSMCLALISLKLLHLSSSLEYLLSRFFNRGIPSIWFAITLMAWGLVIQNIIQRWPPNHSKRAMAVLASKWLLAAFVIAVPIRGSSVMANGLMKAKSFLLPFEIWEAYQFLNQSAPSQSVVLAMDFRDGQLIPLYSDSYIYFGFPIMHGATGPLSVHLKRLIQGLHAIEASPEVIRNWLDTYVQGSQKFRCAPVSPRPSWKEVEGSIVLDDITLESFSKVVDGIPVRTEDGTAVSDAFRIFVEEMLTNRSLHRSSDFESVDYLVLSTEWEQRRKNPDGPIDGFTLVFKNGSRSIYKQNH